MKKIILSILLAILFLSCTTTLKNPSNENVGLVLIPHKVEAPKNRALPGNYTYIIKEINSDFKKTYKIPSIHGTGQLYLPPGNYKISKIGYKESQGYVSNVDDQSIDGPEFSVIDGAITVLPIMFKTIFTQVTLDSFSLGWRYDPITGNEYNKAIDSVRDFDGFNLWAIN